MFGGVILFRKAPKLDRKIQYKQVIVVILIIVLLTVGVIKINTKTGVWISISLPIWRQDTAITA